MTMKIFQFTKLLLVLAIGGAAALAVCANQDQTTPTVSDYAKRAAPPISDKARSEMETRLSEARARLSAEPNNPDALIWVGRRLGYLGRFTEAIDTFTTGIKNFPRDARFYRHRGHRYITLRQFDLAIADLQRAAMLIKGKVDEIEPDGQPNARNVPTSTLQFNIWYHLGLAQYLTGKNESALRSYRECLKVSKNPDSVVATIHWLYMTLRRLQREKEARATLQSIQTGMDIVENDGYYKLVLMYKGAVDANQLLTETLKQENSPGSYSVMYGLGNWHLYNNHRPRAAEIFQKMLTGDQWTSFGYLAAEADVKRSKL